MVNARKHDLRWIYEDSLVIRWQRADKSIVSQGKRISKLCTLSPTERKAYTNGCVIACIKQIRLERKCDLYTALDLFRANRGPQFQAKS